MEICHKSSFSNFFVSKRLFELPIPLVEGFALLDEDQQSLFMTWLGEHMAPQS
jgi:hypothetical protein